MRIATAGKSGDDAIIPAARWGTMRKAEEALQRAVCWSNWMKAAEESQRDRGSSAHLLVTDPQDDWTE
jgi:hypothetical protein